MMRVAERREWMDGEEVRREVVFEEPRTGRRLALRASLDAFAAHPAGLEVAHSPREDGGC